MPPVCWKKSSVFRPRLLRHLPNVTEHIKPVTVREPDVEQDHVEGHVLQQSRGLAG